MDVVTPRAALRLAAALAARPAAVLCRGAGLATELGHVGLGTSSLAPHSGDDRFADPAWVTDPVRRRVLQAWLATTGTLTGLLDDARPDLPAADEDRLRALVAGLTDMACPAGDAGPSGGAGDTGPAGDTGSAGTTGGTGAARAPVPGRDIAATPGAVVLRTPMFELVQYLPRTVEVRDVPVLLVGPLVHRYYLADLAPGHSLVEHLVGAGLQVFALSRPDPDPGDPEAGRVDLDAHAAAVLDAIEGCARITRCPRVTLAGLGDGGLITAAVQSHLHATGRGDRVASAVYLGTALDQAAALPGFRLDTTAARAGGLLDGPTALRAWTWRRGGEQVRPFPTGGPPGRPSGLPDGPARRAAQHWARDLLHVPAAAHADLVALAGADPDRPPPAVLGTPVRPDLLDADAYLVAAADDPSQPWTAGYRTARRLGGCSRLVLARGDRVGALLGCPAAGGFRAGPLVDDASPKRWADAAAARPGSWWPDLAAWLAERSGAPRDAPPELGGRRMHPLHPAPGRYLGG